MFSAMNLFFGTSRARTYSGAVLLVLLIASAQVVFAQFDEGPPGPGVDNPVQESGIDWKTTAKKVAKGIGKGAKGFAKGVKSAAKWISGPFRKKKREWIPGAQYSKDHPSVVMGELPNTVTPAPGYDWVNAPEPGEKIEDWAVRWRPGQTHSHHPNVVADSRPDTFKPRDGFEWINPSSDNFDVKWSPGTPHSRHSNVVAGERPNTWDPRPGFDWVDPNLFKPQGQSITNWEVQESPRRTVELSEDAAQAKAHRVLTEESAKVRNTQSQNQRSWQVVVDWQWMAEQTAYTLMDVILQKLDKGEDSSGGPSRFSESVGRQVEFDSPLRYLWDERSGYFVGTGWDQQQQVVFALSHTAAATALIPPVFPKISKKQRITWTEQRNRSGPVRSFGQVAEVLSESSLEERFGQGALIFVAGRFLRSDGRLVKSLPWRVSIRQTRPLRREEIQYTGVYFDRTEVLHIDRRELSEFLFELVLDHDTLLVRSLSTGRFILANSAGQVDFDSGSDQSVPRLRLKVLRPNTGDGTHGLLRSLRSPILGPVELVESEEYFSFKSSDPKLAPVLNDQHLIDAFEGHEPYLFLRDLENGRFWRAAPQLELGDHEFPSDDQQLPSYKFQLLRDLTPDDYKALVNRVDPSPHSFLRALRRQGSLANDNGG